MKVTQKREVTFDNFYLGTNATFKGCKVPKRKPDYISKGWHGNISSCYWYGKDSRGEFVIRASDHWVMEYEFSHNSIYKDCDRIATCIWHLKSNRKHSKKEESSDFYAGKVYLKNMISRF